MDAATVTLDSSIGIQDRLADGSGGTRAQPVEGFLHSDWLEDHEHKEDLFKIGYSTGLESGTIDSVAVTNEYFTTHADRSGGDSGGPHYYLDSDPYGSEIYIAGLHRGYTGDGLSRAVLFTSIMAEHNIYLGPGYSPD